MVRARRGRHSRSKRAERKRLSRGTLEGHGRGPYGGEVPRSQSLQDSPIGTEYGPPFPKHDDGRHHGDREFLPERALHVRKVGDREPELVPSKCRERRQERSTKRTPVRKEGDGPGSLSAEPRTVEGFRTDPLEGTGRPRYPRAQGMLLGGGPGDGPTFGDLGGDASTRPGGFRVERPTTLAVKNPRPLGASDGVMSFRVPTEARSEKVFPLRLKGRIETHRWSSRVLEGNPWGDPIERDLPIYIPPSGITEGRPLLLLLTGYTGSGWYHYQHPRFLSDTIVGRLDRLIRSRAAPEAVMVGPDCITSLGGSQYLNSTATGRYEDYVMTEVLPWVRERYRTGPVAALGTSSGGYGSLVLALRHPEVIRAAGSNAGDAAFEYCYLPEFPTAFREIRKAGGPEALLRTLFSEPVSAMGPQNHQMQALEMMGYASCYSPIASEPGRFDLPFDLESGEVRADVWARWLAWDPVRMIQTDGYREALRRLAYVYADGGTRDEYGLDVGARIFTAVAKRQGVAVDFQEFDGVHGDGGPRYDVMIPRLLSALGFAPPGAP